MQHVLFTVAKIWKQPKCASIDDWIQKTQYVRTMEHYVALRKDEILPFATTRMDPEKNMLSEMSQIKSRTT